MKQTKTFPQVSAGKSSNSPLYNKRRKRKFFLMKKWKDNESKNLIKVM